MNKSTTVKFATLLEDEIAARGVGSEYTTKWVCIFPASYSVTRLSDRSTLALSDAVRGKKVQITLNGHSVAVPYASARLLHNLVQAFLTE